jgi:hypothetical protein
MVEARHLPREWSPRAVETLHDVMTNGAILRRARIASSGAVAQIFGSGSRVGGRSKLSRPAESILDGTLRFSYEYRPVNRSHCGVRGGGDSGTSLLLASAHGYSRHRVGGRRPVRSQAQMASAPAREIWRSLGIDRQPVGGRQGTVNVAQLMETEAATAMPT